MRKKLILLFAASGMSCVLGMFVIGCTSGEPGQTIRDKGGAQLWSENCTRCHAMRLTTEFGPAQSEIVMMHMRSRANLTAEEARRIKAFLQSAN